VAAEEIRSTSIKVRLRPTLKAALERLARSDDRTLASYVERVLAGHVAQLDKAKPPRKG
jgi:predicted transcriptional regulator